ncbi:MAG: hypothetical protein AB9915_00665 [Candidatus Dojkabacteria bacterium]
MAETKKNKKEELIAPRKSVHVVFFSCSHCGDEVDDIKLCPECGEPMKVIDVVEKFGEDADRFLKRVEKRLEKGKATTEEEEEDYEGIEKEEPNIILMGGDEIEEDGGIDPTTVDDASLDVIYPDDDESPSKTVEVEVDDDLTKALEQLDSEDDDNVSSEDFGFEDGEIPEL